MKISCPEFEPTGVIPERFSQYGANRSPPLDFADIPPEAQSIALIMDDPDAPRGTFTHWVVYDIDANASGFRENRVPKDVRIGRNDYGRPEYAGPRPPAGEHRYFLRAYALDTRLALPEGATREEVEGAMTGHVLDTAELMARYATPVEPA
ncbi:MAG TPA: YbhB/YbcL family Raf kinase inhibitor-like protein [Opitutaceae bacterium]|nr:YbhB/YbcL family Raf kinase inhibitor-like protein [Opitutaceae bacterium]